MWQSVCACESGDHSPQCPIGRGLERFAITDALGGVVGYQWLSPQSASDVRENIAQRRRDDAVIESELRAALRIIDSPS